MRLSANLIPTFVALAAAVALAGCGGGGDARSTPPPPPPPPPAPPPPSSPPGQAVSILESPTTQEFASLTSSGSTADLRVRFDSSTGFYEVSVDSGAWQPLRESATYSSEPENYFSYGPTADESFFQVIATAANPEPGNYRYSSLAYWGKGVGAYWDQSNFTAFGIATSSAAMPVTGSAAYEGLIAGSTDIMEFDQLIGANVAATITGNVFLNFNFGAGTLSGSMQPTLHTFGGSTSLGTLSFVDTVYSTGSTTFSGRFDTALSGANAFDGRFTGPAAQELIGRWAFPFANPVGGTTQSASGAWIARQ